MRNDERCAATERSSFIDPHSSFTSRLGKGRYHIGCPHLEAGTEELPLSAFNILALIKGNERYVFIYDDDSREPLLHAFQADAADPELSFSRYDAAVLTEKAREQAETATPAFTFRET